MKKLFSTRYTDRSVTFGLLLLRICAGGLMMYYGFDKLTHFKAYSAGFTDPFHLGSTVSLCLSIFAEFFCAALVLAGLLTRLACIPLIINMLVAEHYGHHWQITGDGQKAFLFLILYFVILFIGPGKFSLDRLIGK